MRYYNSTGTNCLQCCVAGIFDRRLEDTIDVGNMPADWFSTFREWCKSELRHLPIRVEQTEELLPDMTYVQVGIVDTGICHAAIACNGKMLHNPDPEGMPWKDFLYKIIFVPMKETQDV